MSGMTLLRFARRRRPAAGGGGTSTYSYTPSTAAFPNPSRGWFQYTETHYQPNSSGFVPLSAATLAASRAADNRSVVFRYLVMEKFLTQDTIDQAWLDLVAADLAAVRAAGCTAILRFTYSTSGNITTPPYGADPPLARVLGHIGQIAAVVNAAADVVDAVQAGFIGMWGEWYYTDNFGDQGTTTTQQMTDRLSVATALTTQLDPRVFVLLRYAGLKARWAGLPQARVGYHDDAFQSAYADYGTFTAFSPLSETATRAFLLADTGVPVVGESADLNAPDTLGPAALAELEAMHFDSLNPLYHAGVLASWTTQEKATVDRQLGYRLRVTEATLPTAATAGGPMAVSLTLANDGWSRLHRSRPARLVLVNGATVVTRDLTVDLTTLGAGQTVVLTQTVTAPPAGAWAVHLMIPAPDTANQDRAEYAIRLAHATGWDSTTGRNSLGHTLAVS